MIFLISQLAEIVQLAFNGLSLWHYQQSYPHHRLEGFGLERKLTLPCQKNSHCKHWFLSSSSLKPNTSLESYSFSKYSMMAEVSITAKGGDLVLSMRTGMRPCFCQYRKLSLKGKGKVPLGFKRRNQSFFWSFVGIEINVCVSMGTISTRHLLWKGESVLHSVPYKTFSSSIMIWTFFPFGVEVVIRWSPYFVNFAEMARCGNEPWRS